MSIEFTGERVIPGQVDIDLWNEHIARYHFAAPYCRGRAVLDAGCGAGYGAQLIAREATAVIGLDISEDAIHFADQTYSSQNTRWLAASCAQLPFADESLDVILAFEVIEHLADWPLLLAEANRVLRSSGLFFVSTPNKSFYAETRDQVGPNPYHEHEFEFEEFRDALRSRFPHVRIALQNHTECIVFDAPSEAPAGAHFAATADPESANFYIAICSREPIEPASFVYVPQAANLLKERQSHIRRLEEELTTKNSWMRQAQQDHARLLEIHSEQTAELHARTAWAQELNEKWKLASGRIQQLQQELVEEQRLAQENLNNVQRDLETCNQWAQQLTTELRQHAEELSRCVQLLDQAEATVVERTLWAQGLQRELETAQTSLALARSSRWVKLGRMIHLGPELNR